MAIYIDGKLVAGSSSANNVSDLPDGGFTGQVLAKRTDDNQDVEWEDLDLSSIEEQLENVEGSITNIEGQLNGLEGQLDNVVTVDGGAGMTLEGIVGNKPHTIRVTKENIAGSSGGSSGVAGVSSFNGRTGAVIPKSGDYTADMVGAVPSNAVPTGGTTGQILAKRSNSDRDTQWIDAPSGGSSGGSVDLSGYLTKNNPAFSGSLSRSGATISNGGIMAIGSNNTNATNFNTIAMGNNVTASGIGSIAIGNSNCTASGENSLALCTGQAKGLQSISIRGSEAIGIGSVAIAGGTTVDSNSVAIGTSVAEGSNSIAIGYHAKTGANYQIAFGKFNKSSTLTTDRLFVGKSTGNSDTTRANCLRVTDTGVYASGNYNASGADYAEMFEWADNNPNNEDRRGLFVTLENDKIRLANPEDTFILGVVSGDPSIVGDVQDDQWQGMYMYDIFGSPIWEDVEIEDEYDENGNVIYPAHIEHRQKMNPDYDSTQEYIPRSKRPEWDAVGMMGKLVMVDDGTCVANGYVDVSENGIATFTSRPTRYRVMKRLDRNHIKILVL